VRRERTLGRPQLEFRPQRNLFHLLEKEIWSSKSVIAKGTPQDTAALDIKQTPWANRREGQDKANAEHAKLVVQKDISLSTQPEDTCHNIKSDDDFFRGSDEEYLNLSLERNDVHKKYDV
jgi:hypothetical protein